MNKKKAIQIRLSPDNLEALEKLKATRQEPVNSIINAMIREYSKTPFPGAQKTTLQFYTAFASLFELYMISAIERGVIDKSTRHAAADFYEALAEELKQAAECEAAKTVYA